MVGSEGAAIRPLGVAGTSGTVADGDPSVAADADSVSGERFLEPWNDEFCFGFVGPFGEVVVGKSAVERVLFGDEVGGEVPAPFGGVGVIVPAEGNHPVRIPGGGAVVDGVINGCALADPEHGGNDSSMPWVSGGGAEVGSREGGDDDLGFEGVDGALAKAFGVAGERSLFAEWTGRVRFPIGGAVRLRFGGFGEEREGKED